MILNSEQRWMCPNCLVSERTTGQTNRFHRCAGLAGITAPLVLENTDCKIVAVEREDYIGGENVRLDGNGRPVMAVVTQRADGSNDVTVMAPTAQLRIED